MMKFNFSVHLVSVSPWPLLGSGGVMFSMLGVLKMFYEFSVNLMIWGNLFLVLVIFQWWRDVIRESTYQGSHSGLVSKGLRFGMLLFIVSELMFFVSFFWTYFHLFLSPSVEVGVKCPVYGVEAFNPYNIPLLNTLILLSSGVSITWAHHSLLNNNFKQGVVSMILTIFLGCIFSSFQYMEYLDSSFCMSDSMYGSIFFLATGFHGLHVLIGTLFIMVGAIRMVKCHFSMYHHFGFEAASWYWHFVDIVWLFLYIFIYWVSY